ncbi:hypothetical protein [Phenylobacterium sp.]|uniref:hypothetical protein n=1 Tax=Phenylobacterium sp. TaxID=1871053 RepID=UPI002730321E|nr:hypothetical protein [Phenylobacterium sp.]MDP1874818.1 hypothetical protein [Phenylobacterium sp.]
MAENEGLAGIGLREDDFSFESLLAFQRRMEADPDGVTDDEIREEYGSDISPAELRELFRRSTFGRASKRPRASARAKLRRRLLWLSRSLQEVESAVDAVRKSPGRINKPKELEDLLAAIGDFRRAANLPVPGEPTELDPDLFERLFGIAADDEGPG